MAHCRRFVAAAARNRGRPMAVLWWLPELVTTWLSAESGGVGPHDRIVHRRHDGRGRLAIEFGQPVDQQAQGLRDLTGLLVESDTEPVADFIANGAAMSAVYPQRQGILARHDRSPKQRDFRGQ